MVLGKPPVPGRPTIWIIVGQGPTALAVGVDGGCLDIFTLIYPFFPLQSVACLTQEPEVPVSISSPATFVEINSPLP